jgi:aryl-alcohol dehydrogenase-like predicted oxidoreductase
MGFSKSILGEFVRQYRRENFILSTKFTPQIAGQSENAVEEMLNGSLRRLGTDYKVTVFINHACSFLDMDGITLEEHVLIGPKVNL